MVLLLNVAIIILGVVILPYSTIFATQQSSVD